MVFTSSVSTITIGTVLICSENSSGSSTRIRIFLFSFTCTCPCIEIVSMVNQELYSYTCCSTCIYDCVSIENQALIYIYIDDKVCFPSSVLATVCYHNDALFESYIIPKVFLHSSSHSESSGEKTHDTRKKSAICVQRERSSE